MVSQVSTLAFLAAGVSAAQGQQAAAEPAPYYMQKASQAAVNYLMKYKSAQIADSEASSIAAKIVNGALSQPTATELVASAMSYVATAGPTAEPTRALRFVNQASSIYDAIATKEGYKSYADYVAAQQTAFDLNKAVADASGKAVQYGARYGAKYNGKLNDVIAAATSSYADFKANPAGAAAIQTGKELGKKVASDFHVTAVPTAVSQFKKDLSQLKQFLYRG